jgi:hypothetical protein
MVGKKPMKRLFHIFAILIVAVIPFFSRTAYAASATLYMSPASGSVVQGTYLTVSIHENSDSEPVNAVQANFSYPANLLQFVSISSSSAFSVAAQSTGGGGGVQIGRGALPSVTGDQLVATVQFLALASSGSATLAFSGGSSVVSATSNTNVMTASPGGSYSLAAPPASGAGSASGGSSGTTPPTGSTPAKSTAPSKPSPTAPAAAPTAPPKDTTPPTIKDITTSALTAGSATISWTTSEPATSEIDYGLTTGYGLSATDSGSVTAHKIILNSPLIVPGTTYHFVIKNTDAAGNTATSPDQSFTTKGATLIITVLNKKDGKAIRGAQVSFNGKTATTDLRGKATLTDMPIGNLIGTITINGKQTTETVRITGVSPTGTAQTVAFKVTAQTDLSRFVLVPLILILVAAAWFIGLLGGRGKLPGSGLLARFGRAVPKNLPPSTAPLGPIPQSQPTVIRPTSPSSPDQPRQDRL